jgi:hypothetical protein
MSAIADSYSVGGAGVAKKKEDVLVCMLLALGQGLPGTQGSRLECLMSTEKHRHVAVQQFLIPGPRSGIQEIA